MWVLFCRETSQRQALIKLVATGTFQGSSFFAAEMSVKGRQPERDLQMDSKIKLKIIENFSMINILLNYRELVELWTARCSPQLYLSRDCEQISLYNSNPQLQHHRQATMTIRKLTSKNVDRKLLLGMITSGSVTPDTDIKALWSRNPRFSAYKLKNFRECFKNICRQLGKEIPSKFYLN